MKLLVYFLKVLKVKKQINYLVLDKLILYISSKINKLKYLLYKNYYFIYSIYYHVFRDMTIFFMN